MRQPPAAAPPWLPSFLQLGVRLQSRVLPLVAAPPPGPHAVCPSSKAAGRGVGALGHMATGLGAQDDVCWLCQIGTTLNIVVWAVAEHCSGLEAAGLSH